ncbi:MAG TPA: beta-ketoacyl synthase chain length factor [Steroidobacteraceae bacterium]
MSVRLELSVAGFAVWNSPQGERPQPTLLPPNERRRAPDTVALALAVAQAACANAKRDPAQLPTVFASTYGDMAITDYMCGTLAKTPTMLSPTRFHNSVHNAAAGYWSIATGCRQPYCALGAGPYTFAAGLFAAALQVCADQTDMLLVAYDIDARGPLAQVTRSRGMLGVAMVLAANTEPNPSRLQMTVTADAPVGAAPAANAIAACLPLIAALEARLEQVLSLPLGPQSSLQVQVRHA